MAQEYFRGASVRITADITDTDAVAADPTVSIKVRIMDPTGTRQVEDQAMAKLETGSYEYVYDTAADADLGEWTWEVIVTDGDDSDVTIQDGSFNLRPRRG